MKRLFILMLVLCSLSGCVGSTYPPGATARERWQIDQYEQQQLQQSLDNFNRSLQYNRPQNCSYLNGMLYCW